MYISNKKSISLLIFILSAFCVIFYHNTITLFPAFMHSWTQSDRYALALGFINNGFEFMHPQTFNWMVKDGITRVDFPINEYIIAVLMKILGTTSFVVFRVYTLILSLIGLIYLYLLSKKITKSEIKSWLVVFFVFLSPIYVYYQDGFIPTLPALSFIFIAYYHLFLYMENKAKKHFIISILFFTLAALVRMPFIILMLATSLQLGLAYIKERKISFFEVLISIIGFGLFLLYFLYNLHLYRIYGSIFLDHLMPPKSIDDLTVVLTEMCKHWLFHYFTIWHYFLLLFTVGLYFINFSKKKEKTKIVDTWKLHIILLFIGFSIYFIFMARQYYAHDYYFLDSFFTPILLTFIFSLKNITIQSKKQIIIYSVILGSTIGLFSFSSVKIQTERYSTGPWDRTEITRQNFIGIDKFLEEKGITKDAKILVIDAYTYNVPLILMQRNGYTVLKTSYKEMSTSLFWCKWDYVAIQDNYLVSDVIKNYPLITSLLERIGGTGKVSFYKRSSKMKTKSLKEFLAISPENTLYSSTINFDEPIKDTFHIKGCGHITAENFYSAPNSGFLDSTLEYGATLILKAKELKNNVNLKVLINAAVWSNQKFKDAQIVASVTNPKATVFYQNFFLSDYVKPIEKWQHIEFQFVLPAFQTEDDELKIYLWNPKKILINYDDWEIVIYK